MTLAIGIGSNLRKSPYFEATLDAGVQSFSVYNHMYIPAHFGDPDGEYDRLMTGVAMWDVASQRQVELVGRDAGALAQYLTGRSLARTEPGQGRYVPLCDHAGRVINDPVLLKLAEDRYWLSVADSDVHLWAGAIAAERGMDVTVSEPDVSPMAIQGPRAGDVAEALLGAWTRGLKHFRFREFDLEGIPLLVARSGWSKQGGLELYLRDGSMGRALWERVAAAGAPFGIGPGAPNDVERIESGLLSYGADFRVQTRAANPFELGFGKMIDFAHDFVGRKALEEVRARGPARRWTGFWVEGPKAAPAGHPVDLMQANRGVGHVSEVVWSRRFSRMAGVGLIAVGTEGTCTMELGGQTRTVMPTSLPLAA